MEGAVIAASIMRVREAEMLRASESAQVALERLCGGAACAPVVDGEARAVGIVTASTLLSGMAGFAHDTRGLLASASSFTDRTVGDVMDTAFASCPPEAPAGVVAGLLSENAAAFVVDDGGRLLGVIEPEDLFRALCEHTKK